MSNYLSLPRLEAHLDRLRGMENLTLARRQIERLFGHSDMAERRLGSFARGHRCIIAHSDNCVVFQKVPRH